jgi:hypothetical protein
MANALVRTWANEFIRVLDSTGGLLAPELAVHGVNR